MAKIHINSHTTNIFCTNLQSCGGFVAEAVGVFEDFEHVGDVVRRFVGCFGVGYAVEVRSQNHPVAIVDSIFDALFPFRRRSHRYGGFFVSHTQNTGIDCPLFTNYSYLCQCVL